MSAVAARQHAILGLDDIRAAGASKQAVAKWASNGRLHRLFPGVYSLIPPQLLSQEGWWLAAVKAGGPRAALSHGPAGQLQWLVDRRLSRALHVTIDDRTRRQPRGIVIHRPRVIAPADFTERAGIPVTTPTRTVWDLAATDLPSVTRRAYERADANGRIDRKRLKALLDACPGHRGAGLVRQLLAQRRLPLEAIRSWLEGLLLHICSERNFPFPAVNVPLLGYEADFLWEREKFIVEADGGDHLTQSQRDRDNERDAVHGAADYLVRRFSAAAMEREAEIAREIASTLEKRRRLAVAGRFGPP
jgi:very-short-patch-repair endonuclease